MRGRCRLHSSPLYEFEDLLVILPLAATTVVMLEAESAMNKGPFHRLAGNIDQVQLASLPGASGCDATWWSSRNVLLWTPGLAA